MMEQNSDLIEYLNRCLTFAKEMGDRAEEGVAYCSLGNVYEGLGNFQQALECHKNDLFIANELGDKAAIGRAYGNLGNVHQSLGKVKQAIEYHNKDLEIAKEVGDRVREGAAYCNLGVSYGSLGDVQQSIKYNNQYLAIAKDLGDRAAEGGAYCNIGNDYQSLGNFQQALEYHNKHLSIAKEMGDRAAEGRAYCNLGNDYQRLGNPQQAIDCHKKDLSIAKEMGNKASEGRAYGNLGIAYHRLGNFQEAIEYHTKRLIFAKEVGDRVGEGNAYSNLGSAYRKLGDFKQAIENHKKHLSIAKEVGDMTGQGRAYGNLGMAYQSLGDFHEAIKYHDKDLSISKKVGDRAGEGAAHGTLGNAYSNLRNFEKAIEHHNDRLIIAKEVGDKAGEGAAYGNLGNDYLSLGNFQQAMEYHNKHLLIIKETGDRAREGGAYCNLGNAYQSVRKFQQAIEYYNKYLAIAKQVGDRAAEGGAYCNLGDAYRNCGNFQEALSCYENSVRSFDITRSLLQYEDAWKISFRDHCSAAYTGLWITLLNLRKINQALCAVEKGRAQALVDGLKMQYGLNVFQSASIEPKETLSYILNELYTRTAIIGIYRNTINFWVISKENGVHFTQWITESTSADENPVDDLLESTFKQIKAGVNVRCENRSFDELTDERPTYRVGDDEQSESTHSSIESLQPLYDAVIGPIADLCKGDELIIVPDGALCLAPLAALSESIRIRIVPSLTSLKLILASPENHHCKSGALLVGDPCLEEVTNKRGKPMFKQLKYARAEVEMIGEILKIPPLTGKEATKKEVLERLTSVALVHIAAHGRKETGEIALAPNLGWEKHQDQKSRSKIKVPKEEDYILKMSDVLDVKLRARIVVLSCCHSGRGEVKSEGVVGIARAFLAAGARSVLVSLWAISDKATLEFMKSFYQSLSDGKSASVALHQAMKSLRDSEKFCAVKYWAPFVLIGDDVTLEFGENVSTRRKSNLP